MAIKKRAVKKKAVRLFGHTDDDDVSSDDDMFADGGGPTTELTDLLQAEPSPESWDAVMQHLMELPASDRSTIAAACEQATARADRWNDEWRTAPDGLLETLPPAESEPRLELVRQLDIGSAALDADRALQVLRRVELEGLTGLDLAYGPVGQASFIEMLSQLSARALRRLRVTSMQLKDHHLAALADWPGFERVRVLEAGQNQFTPKGVAALALSPLAAKLEVLDLSAQPVGGDGVRALFSPASKVTSLRVLRLNATRFNDAAARAIAASPHAAHLRQLELKNAEVSTDGVVALADCEALANLEVLDLGESTITGEFVWPIAASPHLRGLKSLKINGADITAADGEQLARWPGLATLEELEFGGYDSDEGVAAFFRSRPRFGRLRRLAIYNVNFDEPELGEALAATGLNETLEELIFDGVYPDDGVTLPMLARPAWPKLKTLELA